MESANASVSSSDDGLRSGTELTIARRESYYGAGAKGCTDWPTTN